MIGSTRADAIKIDVGKQESCCARHRKCVRCCGCCCLLTILLLVVVGVIFWPRTLLICIDYSRTTLRLEFTHLPPKLATSFTLPVSVKSENLWGIHLTSVGVDGYYKGQYDAVLARGKIDSLTLKARAKTSFNVTATPVELSSAQLVSAVDYFTDECGLLGQTLDPTATWQLDLKVTVEVLSQTFEFWIRDVEVPCHSVDASGGIELFGVDGGCEDGKRRPADGKYCIELFCAIDDLMCEKSCPAASDVSRSPAPPPPAAPPSPLALLG